MALNVLMAGTSPDGKGGIATVVSVLRQAGFFEKNQVRYLITHADGPVWRKGRLAWSACWQVFAICLRERPVFHVHAASRASFFRKSLLLAIARGCGSKTVLHLHGAEFKQFATKESGPLARWWIRRTLDRSSVVITLSHSWAEFLAGFAPAARVRVVANSVPLPPADGGARVQAARILFLGRAEQRKGIFELLAAVAQLRARFPDIRLVIGGDGELAEVRRLARQLDIADHVEVLGWIDAGRRAEELARAAIFCLPSHNEGLPMAMLEAMAAGKAVLVTAVGGIPEAVQDRDNGMLVAPGDRDALVAGLRALLEAPQLRAQLGARARATVACRFGTEVVMAQLRAIHAELALASGA